MDTFGNICTHLLLNAAPWWWRFGFNSTEPNHKNIFEHLRSFNVFLFYQLKLKTTQEVNSEINTLKVPCRPLIVSIAVKDTSDWHKGAKNTILAQSEPGRVTSNQPSWCTMSELLFKYRECFYWWLLQQKIENFNWHVDEGNRGDEEVFRGGNSKGKVLSFEWKSGNWLISTS